MTEELLYVAPERLRLNQYRAQPAARVTMRVSDDFFTQQQGCEVTKAILDKTASWNRPCQVTKVRTKMRTDVNGFISGRIREKARALRVSKSGKNSAQVRRLKH